jgi:hypothetical protein
MQIIPYSPANERFLPENFIVAKLVKIMNPEN